MRAFYWIIGALASAAAGTYLVSRRAQRKALAAAFLEALGRGSVTIRIDHGVIHASGVPGDRFIGTARDLDFEFVMASADGGHRQAYRLTWADMTVSGDWSALKGTDPFLLHEIYIGLVVLRDRRDDLSN